MPSVSTRIPIQVGAATDAQMFRVDKNLATRIDNLAKNGWTKGDTDKLVRSPQLNDKAPIPGADEYGNKTEGNLLRPMMAKARDMRTRVVINDREFKFTTASSRDYFESQLGKWFALNAVPPKGAKQNAKPGNAGKVDKPVDVGQVEAPKGTSLEDVRAANKAIVALLAKATTMEPVTDSRNRWQTKMREVVTFGVEGSRSKGSLERFAEANGLGSGIKDVLIQAARYGAHAMQGESAGVLAFVPTERNLANLERRLNALYERRDDGNGVLSKAEIAEAKETANGKALFTGQRLSQLANLDTDQDFQSELAFSKQTAHAMDLLYSRGNIRGRGHVNRIVAGLEANGQDAEAEAVRASYSSVSRYISRGRTSQLNFICKDQRREVQRAIMRTFGAAQDRTERAVSALEIPARYR